MYYFWPSMSLFITSLNSGSNGNCYYIGNEQEAILIDAGISCRETEKRMKRIGLSMSKVRAIFVSHEHSDHITGIPGISKKYQLPVYFTAATYQSSGIPVNEKLLRYFSSHQLIRIGGLTIKAFPKFHDAQDPHSFMVSGNKVNIGVFTDIGSVCKELIHHFKKCHAAFLEANYCADMLARGNYPVYLKKRISSDTGHLSNAQAMDLFLEHRSPRLSQLILSHLSQQNNHPDLVESMFSPLAGNTKITIASRYHETDVFEICSTASGITARSRKVQQLSMF
jgi:phosphoribosyl 1,2-cyclic phosphodiesterase